MSKSLIIGTIGVTLVVLAVLLNFTSDHTQEIVKEEPKASKKNGLSIIPKVAVINKDQPEESQIKAPSFDIVRVTIEGNTVMAGQAMPESKIEIYDHGEKIGEVFADKRGEWVFVPSTHLAPGTRKLSLKMINPNGLVRKSTSDLVILIPEKDIAGTKINKPSKPLAIKIPEEPGGRLEILQKSGPEATIPVTIDTIDYDDAGKLNIAGGAPAQSTINLYLNDKFLGRCISNKRGLWYQTPKQKVKPGKYTLRADHVSKNGQVKSRIEVIFARSIPLTGIKPGAFIVVESGRSLWRIARKTYGTGLRYLTIYEANKDQIRNPDMIFPGQVFSLPTDK